MHLVVTAAKRYFLAFIDHIRYNPPQAPATTGAFYFFSNTKRSHTKAHSIPGTITAHSSGLPAFNRTFINNRQNRISQSRAKPSLGFHNNAPQQLAIVLMFHQQAADEIGGDDLSRAGEEGLGEAWEVLGGRGGYGSGSARKR